MRGRSSGFTLIEVLIATAILAMLLTLITSALFAMTRNARAGEARMDRNDEVRLVHAFLRRQLSEAVPLTDRTRDANFVLFDGGPSTLRFVGHLPAHRGGGGLQFLELAVEPRGQARALVLSSRNAWTDADLAPRGGRVETEKQTLLENAGSIRFRYFGNQDDESRAEWRERWAKADRLPALIELELGRTDGVESPPIVVAVRSRTAIAQSRLFRLRENGE